MQILNLPVPLSLELPVSQTLTNKGILKIEN